jgi:16S rRNA (cytidine1402-2'-O)-methyltransferase
VTKLYIIATPIGNLEDMTLRAIRVLGEVGALACEDTRHTRILFAKHGIPSPRTILSYREQNEDLAGARIIGMLKQGLSVGICSDAGYPGISDSGYRVIVKAIQEGFPVEVIPGAGAIEPALLSSGLPTSSFTFKGFPPRKPGVRRRFLEMDKDLPHTLVFYESPFRLQKLLVDALGVLGDRLAAVCIELTKQFERVHRGSLSELAAAFQDQKVRGEITVVIAGNNPKFAVEEESSDEGAGQDAEGDPTEDDPANPSDDDPAAEN